MRSLVVGLAVATVVFLVGFVYLAGRPRPWSAEAVLLVHPAPDTPSNAAPAFYETLGNGQAVATYAKLLRRRELLSLAVRETSRDLAVNDVDATVTVIPDTALISVRVTAGRDETAVKVTNALAQAGRNQVGRLEQPYSLSVVGSADGTAERKVSASVPLLAALAVVAAIAGLGAQQAWSLLVARPRRVSRHAVRPGYGEHAPVGVGPHPGHSERDGADRQGEAARRERDGLMR